MWMFKFFCSCKSASARSQITTLDIRISVIAQHTWCNYHVVDRCRILKGKKKVKNWKVIKLSNLKVEISVCLGTVYLTETENFLLKVP